VVTADEDKRWCLVPRWWSKPLKELRVATLNARAETIETKPFFGGAFKRSCCLISLIASRSHDRAVCRHIAGISLPKVLKWFEHSQTKPSWSLRIYNGPPPLGKEAHVSGAT
jgi:hypothetical protein